MKLPSKPVLIGGAVVLVVLVVLIATGAWKPLIVFVLGLFGVGGAVKRAKKVQGARREIAAAKAEHETTTEELNARQAERAEKDAEAVEEAADDPGPVTIPPKDDDAREAELERLSRERWEGT